MWGLNGADVTAILLALALAGAGVYDVWAGIYLGPDATVTVLIRTLSRNYPVIPFGAGLLCGHLFWGK